MARARARRGTRASRDHVVRRCLPLVGAGVRDRGVLQRGRWSAIVVNPHRTVLGIVPTPPGLVVWLHGVFAAPHVLRTAVVPVPPVGHALELALFAFWIAAAGTAWSAAKHDGVLIALLPSFALFVTIASLGKGAYVTTTTLWCAAAGAFLLVQHADAVLRARTGFQAVAAHRSRLLSGGATAAVLAIMFGAIVGPRLPEASSAGLLDYRGHGGGSSQIVDISPLLGIGDQLRQPKPVQLFTVTASTQARWRLMALDQFNGAYWGLHETTTTSSIPADSGPHLANVQHASVIQQYAIGPMGGKFLPAAYRADQAPDLSNLVVIPDSATLVVNDENHQGLDYAVTSSLVGASPATLRQAPPVDTRDPMVAQDLQLPSTFAPRISDEAKRIVADAHATTEYDKALALQNYFRDPKRFTYDQNVNLSESTNAMEDFLFNVRRGFCEQFAGTYAAMARAVGLPTRVAVGFQPGAVIKQGTNADGSQVLTYSVTTKEAHAWPEVYFPQVGWIAFEPTPGRYDYDSPGDPNGTRVNAPPYVAGGGHWQWRYRLDHHGHAHHGAAEHRVERERRTSQPRAGCTSYAAGRGRQEARRRSGQPLDPHPRNPRGRARPRRGDDRAAPANPALAARPCPYHQGARRGCVDAGHRRPRAPRHPPPPRGHTRGVRIA